MNYLRFATFSALILIAYTAQAIESSYSGFAQVTVGSILGGSPTTGQASTNPYTYTGKPGSNYNCPCFVANFEHAGVYESGKTAIAPESLTGVQGNFSFNQKASATVQVVARGADNSIGIDWAVVSYKLAPDITLQVGRKRLPLYYYSDFMYVGYAYPWIRPPQDLYGWQMYSYDGANLMYNTKLDQWALTANVWMGSRTDKDNATLGKLYYRTQIDESWNNMVGAYLEGIGDIVTSRIVYMHASVKRFQVINGVESLVMTGENGALVNDVGQDFYGLSVNADYNNWLFRNELNYIDRPSVLNNYLAQSYSAGYQLGSHTVMLTWAQFLERAAYWPDGVEKHTTESISYRWDFAKAQALKVQYDQIKDETKYLFMGNANLLSASWQIVF